MQPTGAFVYTPNPHFHGTDTFRYQTSDGLAASNPATVTITVNHVNHAPVATADSYTVTGTSFSGRLDS